MVILGYLDYGVTRPTVLDIGCGSGRLISLLARVELADYLGIDFSIEAIRRAEALTIPGTRFEVADMNVWEASERFDTVVLCESLYYADDPRRMFERSLGWLTEGGIVIVSIFKPAPGAHRIWSSIAASAVEPLAASTLTDQRSGNAWDIMAMRRSC